MKAFVRMAGAFFVSFLWDLGGEPYGREQNQGDHCRDWRRYHESKRLIFRYDRKIPDYFSVAGAP